MRNEGLGDFRSVDFPVAPNFPNAMAVFRARGCTGQVDALTPDVDTGAIDRQQTLDVLLNFRVLMTICACAIAMAILQPLLKTGRRWPIPRDYPYRLRYGRRFRWMKRVSEPVFAENVSSKAVRAVVGDCV